MFKHIWYSAIFIFLKEISPRTFWPIPIWTGCFLLPLYIYLGTSTTGISFTSLLDPISSFLVYSSYVRKGTREVKYLRPCMFENISTLLSHLIDTLADYRILVIFLQNCESMVLLSFNFQCCSWEVPCCHESWPFI